VPHQLEGFFAFFYTDRLTKNGSRFVGQSRYIKLRGAKHTGGGRGEEVSAKKGGSAENENNARAGDRTRETCVLRRCSTTVLHGRLTVDTCDLVPRQGLHVNGCS